MLGIVDIDYGQLYGYAIAGYAKACNHTLFAYATNALQVCALGAVARSSSRDEVHVRKEL